VKEPSRALVSICYAPAIKFSGVDSSALVETFLYDGSQTFASAAAAGETPAHETYLRACYWRCLRGGRTGRAGGGDG
jgi:hypothetical protein